ncbi:hypothetical protein MD484_g1655, partial [Candolleomyces efflorescens]
MPFESGKIYKLSNFKTGSALTLKSSTCLVVGDMFEGKPNQLWEAESTPMGSWSFKNVEHPGLYLGLERKIVANDGELVVGVSYPFAWAPKRVGKAASPVMFKLCIPYTNQVLDLNLNGGWANGIRIQVYTDWGVRQDNQKWIINTNTTFKHPVTAGGIYRITNRASGTVVHVEDSKKVAGYSFNDGRNQKWEAILDELTGFWCFRNPWSGLYLAIDSDLNPAEKVSKARVVGVPQRFAWDLLLARGYGHQGEECRIVLPYTDLHLDLDSGKADPGAIINISPRETGGWRQLWKFELIDGGNLNVSDAPAVREPV